MDRIITKVDDFTIKISGTTPYEQDVTLDQLNARMKELDNHIASFEKQIADAKANKVEVQALIEEATKSGVMTRDEWQKLQPKEEIVNTTPKEL